MGLHESVRPSPIFLGLVGLTTVGAALAWLTGSSVRPLAYAGVFVFAIAGWLVSLCLHEFGMRSPPGDSVIMTSRCAVT
ncbi:putative membrane protein [Mycobacterium ulcerans str. Harvey]|uniref:Membrane protein n=1 Tax=Mycobacterium ulcerans str. Harvey TaxID=1299332 RepID=A0ABN0R508_MYCUL|nr:putative membrane protein [Mycobacterium ulcerans str. Harvey]